MQRSHLRRMLTVTATWCWTIVCVMSAWADAPVRFAAPNDRQELERRIEQLRAEFAPYLRSLPAKIELRNRESLGGNWKFIFEVKDPPRDTKAVPPAPWWFTPDVDDATWETTTVPEWRYRTRGHDNAYDLKTLDKWLGYRGDQTTSQICWYRRTFHADMPAGGQRLWLCFDGVDWEAQVFLNGKLLGTHRVYYEPFRFDITDKVKPGDNSLAVRVIDGREYGEPMTYWATFPDIRAEQQRYTPERTQSIQGNRPIGYHAGTGFGIWRDVYLEQTGAATVTGIFARNDLSDGSARIKVELDSAAARKATLKVVIMPENFDGQSFDKALTVNLPAGASEQKLAVPMPGAKAWSPGRPNLYRCRVTVVDGDDVVDAQDALFGCRSFTIVHRKYRPPVYGFQPIQAKWLRIVGRGSDASRWNSIWEVQGAALASDPQTVTASGQAKGYEAAKSIDGKDDTRWAVEGDGWIQFQLDPTVKFDELTIGWYEAHRRQWDFDLLVSDDGEQWNKLAYMQSNATPTDQLPNGMLTLNGKPCYLRGTNIQGLNVYAYWGQTDQLVHAVLMLKAGYFNAVRVCQHVQMPEVREVLDRLGIMSQQDQGGGYHGKLPYGIRREQHVHTGTVLSRVTYNNPGVVLLCFGNEHEFDTAAIVRAGLAVDPQRIFKPISGRFTHSRTAWDLPEELRPSAIDDGHPYYGWYGRVLPHTWNHPSPLASNTGGGGRMVTLGEFGAEAMDGYETMKTYPQQFAPPPPDADSLWACSQVEKHDVKQIVGLGRKPTNLAEYIEASQNYQEALLADRMIQMRLLPHGVAGYFHFHFMDVVPVFWPKSIVSHDHRPKKAYYQIAQINQPVVVLPRLSGQRPDAMTLWVANDLPRKFDNSTVAWKIVAGDQEIAGSQQIDVPAINAVEVQTVDLKPLTAKIAAFDLTLTLTDAQGNEISRYRRNVRVVPEQVLK